MGFAILRSDMAWYMGAEEGQPWYGSTSDTACVFDDRSAAEGVARRLNERQPELAPKRKHEVVTVVASEPG